jgi:hypothetical protein
MEESMEERTFWETIKSGGDQVLKTVEKVVHEGNVRRVIVKQGDRSVAEFPLTVGVVGTVFAPVLAAIGALTALLTDCTILVERVQTAAPPPEPPAGEAPQPPQS